MVSSRAKLGLERIHVGIDPDTWPSLLKCLICFNEAAGWVRHLPHAAYMQAEAIPRVWCQSNRDEKKLLVKVVNRQS